MNPSDTYSYSALAGKAWPLILANASVPLLGLVDTAVVGNTGTLQDLGAIAFGALIFSFVYWSFGFLRMGTTGFIARASGAGERDELRAILGRALLIGGSLGCTIVVMQGLIGFIALGLLDGTPQVEAVTGIYFYIRVWGAPATLMGFALMGVLVGLGESRKLLALQVFLNGSNAVLDVYFAGYLGWGAAGIATGTLLAEWCTLFFGLYLVIPLLRDRDGAGPYWNLQQVFARDKLLGTLSANADIMIRTLLLVFSFAFFTNQSARFGDTVLAANHILLQFVSFSAFFLDGYAFVAESLSGQAHGAGNSSAFDTAVRRTSILALGTACILSLLVLTGGEMAAQMLTDFPVVRNEAQTLLPMAALYILLSFGAFQLDGVFIGTSATRQMLYAAILSTGVFLLAWALLTGLYGVWGLWAAMIIFVVARALALGLFYPALRRGIGT